MERTKTRCSDDRLNSPPLHSILVVDDDRAYCELCVAELAPRRVISAPTAADGFAIAGREQLDLAFVDLFIDEPSNSSAQQSRFTWGIDLVAQLRSEHSNLPLIIVSGGSSLPFAEAGKAAGANATVPKQFFSPSKIVRLFEDGRVRELEQSCMPRKPMSLARNEREYLTGVYVENAFNAARSARALGISRSTFYSKLRKWRE